MESRRKDRLLVRLFEELQEADLSTVVFGDPVSKENSPDTVVNKQPELDKESEKLQKEQDKKAEPPKEEKAPKNMCPACREGEVIDGKCNKCGSTTQPAGDKPKETKESISEAVPEPMYKVIATVSNADVAKKIATDNKGEVKQTKDGRWEVLVKVSEAEEDNPNTEAEPKEEKPEEEPKGEKFEVTDNLVDELGKKLGVDFEKVDRAEFKKGLEIEQEHVDVTKGDPEITAKIALAHIAEIPDYYKRLVKMEADAKAGEAPAIEDDKQEDLIIAFDEDSLSREIENFIVKKLGFAVTGVGDGVVEFEGKGDAKKIERTIRDNFGWMLKFDIIKMADFLEENAAMLKDTEFMKQHVNEVSPPGWEPTVKAMKKHKEIANPWALAWWMKKKGYKSHAKESAVSERKINEDGSEEEMRATLDKFIEAGWELSEKWSHDAVRNYPSYLPSFDEFLVDFSRLMEEDTGG